MVQCTAVVSKIMKFGHSKSNFFVKKMSKSFQLYFTEKYQFRTIFFIKSNVLITSIIKSLCDVQFWRHIKKTFCNILFFCKIKLMSTVVHINLVTSGWYRQAESKYVLVQIYSVVSIKRTGSLNYFEVFSHPVLFFHVLKKICTTLFFFSCTKKFFCSTLFAYYILFA